MAHADSIRAGETTFDLKGAEGEYVLLWITRLASGPPGPGSAAPLAVYTVQVGEIKAFACG